MHLHGATGHYHNIDPTSDPMTVTLDVVGPTISITQMEFAIVRARDVWDNRVWKVVIIPPSEVYLPVVLKLE